MMNKKILLLTGMVVLLILSSACGSETTQPPASNGPSDSSQPGETPPTLENNVVEPPKNVQALKVVSEPEFFQETTVVGYTFMVENPNRDIAIQNMLYRVSASDATGAILTSGIGGLIDTVLPGERTAEFGVLNVDSSEKVAKVDIQLTPGPELLATAVKIKPPVFSIEQTRYIPDQVNYVITGLLENHLDKNLVHRPVRVAVLVFDDTGRFIYGTNVDLGYVPAKGKVAVEVRTYDKEAKPARVEMYPMLGDLEVLDDPTADDNLLAVVDQSITLDPNFNSFEGGFIVENKDPTRAVLELQYQITAYDSEGVLGTSSSELDSFLLPPGQRTGLLVPDGAIPTGMKADRFEIQVGSGKTYEGPLPALPLEADELVLGPGDSEEITGVIKNNSGNEFKEGCGIVVLLFDENGGILAGGSTSIDGPIPANGTTPFEIWHLYPSPIPGKVARVEAYIHYCFSELQR